MVLQEFDQVVHQGIVIKNGVMWRVPMVPLVGDDYLVTKHCNPLGISHPVIGYSQQPV